MEAAQRDFARLLYMHSPTWRINAAGVVSWVCGCDSPGPHSHESIYRHIQEAVRRARGPDGNPQK